MRFDSLSLIHKVRPLDIFHNQPVTDAIKNLNGCNKVSSITCFEFSTPLQKSIPYCKLISVLNEHIDFCFKGGDGNLLQFIKKGVSRITRYHLPRLLWKRLWNIYSRSAILSWVIWSLDKTIGIAMGSDLATCFPNLFLYCYENE